MADFPFRIVGFDLDGTLLDTSADLTAAVNHALDSVGRPVLTVERVKTMIGGGGKHMLAQGMAATGGCDPDELDRLFKILLGYYEAHIADQTRPFPGAMAVIDRLDAMGVKCAIVTNKHEAMADKVLRELGIRDRFAALIGGDTMGPGMAKPHRAPIDEMVRRSGGGAAAFVGDSIYDITAAKNADLPSVACSFGFLMQPVEELQADAIIDHFDELIPTLERLG